MQKLAKNMHHKLVLDLFLILVNSQKQPVHARNFWKTIIEKPDFFLCTL